MPRGQHALRQTFGRGLVKQLAQEHELLVTVEEGSVMGGAGSAVAEFWPLRALCGRS